MNLPSENEYLFEKIKSLPPNEACVICVTEFWNATDDNGLTLLKLFHQKKDECVTPEERFELAIALYEAYKSGGNKLAFHMAKLIVKEL
ncbi:MAG: hypothetical protein E7583_03580 [Ruminococcaceae bacterium]|nr:hypothetical protein [Oscillospiraceae bacterium]